MTDPSDPDDLANQDPAALLPQIRQKAEKLLNQLIAEAAQLDAHPPKLSPEALAEGKAAMQHAIAAAQRTIAALDAAAEGPEPSDERPDRQHRWN